MNDGLPERARIKPCRYWLSDFLVRRVLAHVRITANLVHQIQAGSTSPSTFAVHLEEYLRPLGAPNFREAQVVPLRSSSCLSPDLVVARPFPSAFTTIAFGYSRRRWFETCSCKPVPRGLPSSVKQLRTTQHFSFRARGTHLSPYRRSFGPISD